MEQVFRIVVRSTRKEEDGDIVGWVISEYDHWQTGELMIQISPAGLPRVSLTKKGASILALELMRWSLHSGSDGVGMHAADCDEVLRGEECSCQRLPG